MIHEFHHRAVASTVHLVGLLAADLQHLSPEERGDTVARALAAGIVAAYRGADPRHVVQRLRRAADWIEARTGARTRAPIPVPTPDSVPEALARLAERRFA